MVFFTCNHCGESLKKAAVEKHYNQRCKNGGVFVSCMDCQKDFRDDYVGHTKCITEAEKYSGKDYVHKESKNSGQKKQESWLEIVRSILATKEFEVSPVVRGIFQKLESYENVPRKKAKFENFVKNSMRVRQDQAAAVWTVLEKAQDKLKSSKMIETNGNMAQKNGGRDETLQLNGNSENGTNEENPDAPAQQEEKSKKKRKKSKIQQAEEQNDPVTEVVENQEEPPKKKKKKKDKEALTENGKDSATQKTNGHTEKPLEAQSAENTKESLEDSTVVDSQKKPKDRAVLDFDWEAVIFKILGKHNDEMGLEDLKSKVLKRYKKNHQIEEVPYKVEKTFNKKLKKSGLLMEGEVVKITAK